jgi:hypothetical protein
MGKYYKPTVAELHLGFEYERLESVLVDHGWHQAYEKRWLPKVIDEQYILKYYGGWEFTRDVEDDLLRVKYLSGEDLVELGFKHVGGKLCRHDLLQDYTLDNGRYYVHIRFSRFTDWASLRIETSVEETSVRTLVVHSIRVKNKSELVKLMKQLNVL